jgi:glycosyltransferase involved in cell wall biosynthesis
MLAIYARPSYLGNRFPKATKDLSTQRISSRVRGEELAQFVKCKLNPIKRDSEDVCVWVKPMGLSYVRDGDYLDYLDGGRCGLNLDKRNGIRLIAASQNSFETLRQIYTNEVFLIPSQHLNWERYRHVRPNVTTCGYIGSPSPQAFKIYKEIGNRLSSIDLKFKTCFDFKTREDAVNFYRSIDLLIIGAWEFGDPNPHKIPTKIINAASFGIPTLAYPLGGYKEIECDYVPIFNMDGILQEADKFRQDDKYYQQFGERIRLKAEAYHIEKIAKMFEALC